MSISKTSGYRALLGRAAYRRLALADVCARLPQGMLSVALLLVAAEYRPVAVAGLALSGYTLGQGVSSPYRGRLADRYGLARVATVCLVGYVAAMTGVAVAAASAIPAGTVILASTIAGLSTPPLSAGMRGLWSAATPPFLRPTAFALDATVFNACYIAGPALAGAVASAPARPPASASCSCWPGPRSWCCPGAGHAARPRADPESRCYAGRPSAACCLPQRWSTSHYPQSRSR
jgi:MFS family permease